MYEEKMKACEPVRTEQDQFTEEVYERLMSFNLEIQNEILRNLHGRTKEDRHLKLSELKKEAEYIDSSLAKLG
jgi:hypothetical protein